MKEAAALLDQVRDGLTDARLQLATVCDLLIDHALDMSFRAKRDMTLTYAERMVSMQTWEDIANDLIDIKQQTKEAANEQ